MARLNAVNVEFAVAALLMLVLGGGMAAYEWLRVKAKRPLLAGHQAVVLYWVLYLSLLVLGSVCALAAVVK